MSVSSLMILPQHPRQLSGLIIAPLALNHLLYPQEHTHYERSL